MKTIREIIDYHRLLLSVMDEDLNDEDIELIDPKEQETHRQVTRDTISYLEMMEKRPQ